MSFFIDNVSELTTIKLLPEAAKGGVLQESFFFNKVAGLRPATLLNKRLWHRFFPFEFCVIFKKTFFYRTRPVTGSVLCLGQYFVLTLSVYVHNGRLKKFAA